MATVGMASIEPNNKMLIGESPKGDAPSKGGPIRNTTNPPNFKKSTSKN